MDNEQDRSQEQLRIVARINGRDLLRPVMNEEHALVVAESLFNQYGEPVETVYLFVGKQYVTQYFSRRDVLWTEP
jgi:hypothetical protein